MNRRNFFSTMIGGVAAAAAVRTWPFRVYSFPSQIYEPTPSDIYQAFGSRIIRGMVDPHTMAVLNATRRRLPQDITYDIQAFAFDHDRYQRAHTLGELNIVVVEAEKRPIRIR